MMVPILEPRDGLRSSRAVPLWGSLHRVAVWAMLAATLTVCVARSQDADRRDALEPRADTSAATGPGPVPPGPVPPRPGAPAASAGRAAPAPAAGRTAAAKPDVATQQKSASDHVDLDTTTVTGNQELPRVMYIVPWKKSDIGDLAGKPLNSLLDEVLAPVDRDVFRRELRYYDAVKAQSPGDAVPAGRPAGQVEK